MEGRRDVALRAGLFVLLGLVVFIAAALWLPSFVRWRRGQWFIVEFSRVMGLQPGSEVMVQGMKVGVVDELRLQPPSTVQVVVRLEQPVPVYYPPASQITIRIGALLGRPYVDIVNRSVGRRIEQGAVVRGIDPVSWEELMPQANELVDNLNRFLGDPQLRRDLQATAHYLAEATRRIDQLLASLSPTDVRETITRLQQAGERLNALLTDHRWDAIINHVHQATRQIAKILADPRVQRDLPRSVHDLAESVRAVRQGIASDQTQREIVTMARNLRESSERLKQLLSEEGVGGEVRKTLAEAREAISALRAVVADPKVQSDLKTAAQNLADLTGKGQTTMDELNATLQQLRQFVTGTEGNLRQFSEHLRNIAQDLDETLDAIKWLVTEGGVKENLGQVAENLRASSENIREATQAIRDLIKDEKTQSSLREGLQELGPTIRVVRETAEQGKTILTQLQTLTQVEVNPAVRVWWHPERDEWRKEAWLSFRSPATSLGLLGGTYTDRRGTRLNLQIQGQIAPSLTWRLGVRRSKLGAGISWERSRWRLDVDVYDPDRWHGDAWLRWFLSPALSLQLGMEDWGRTRLFGIGVAINPPP